MVDPVPFMLSALLLQPLLTMVNILKSQPAAKECASALAPRPTGGREQTIRWGWTF